MFTSISQSGSHISTDIISHRIASNSLHILIDDFLSVTVDFLRIDFCTVELSRFTFCCCEILPTYSTFKFTYSFACIALLTFYFMWLFEMGLLFILAFLVNNLHFIYSNNIYARGIEKYNFVLCNFACERIIFLPEHKYSGSHHFLRSYKYQISFLCSYNSYTL